MEDIFLQDDCKADPPPAEGFPDLYFGGQQYKDWEKLSNAFKVMGPPGRVALFWVHELLLSEIVFQSMPYFAVQQQRCDSINCGKSYAS